MKLILALVFVLVCVYCEEAKKSTLQLVHVFFRHGSRTPENYEIYPTDTHAKDDFYPTGFGQLTNDGKQESYKLGQLLRARYKDFLGETYIPNMVFAKSTDFDRTKMSLLLVLASLFSPSSSQIWNSNLYWQPIPYVYVKNDKDYELRTPAAYCPAFHREMAYIFASDSVTQLLKEHTTAFQHLTKHTGKPVKTLIDVCDVFQTFIAEDNMNLTLPKWTESVYPTVTRHLAAQRFYLENSTPFLKRINGGRMLKKVVHHMVQKALGLLHPMATKIYLYSGHDTNIVNILSTLNVYQLHFPNYSSAVILELHHSDETDQDFVKVLHLKDINEQLEELTIPECHTSNCPLENFIEITKPYLPVNYTKECDSSVFLD